MLFFLADAMLLVYLEPGNIFQQKQEYLQLTRVSQYDPTILHIFSNVWTIRHPLHAILQSFCHFAKNELMNISIDSTNMLSTTAHPPRPMPMPIPYHETRIFALKESFSAWFNITSIRNVWIMRHSTLFWAIDSASTGWHEDIEISWNINLRIDIVARQHHHSR